jgi:hypothetical protein
LFTLSPEADVAYRLQNPLPQRSPLTRPVTVDLRNSLSSVGGARYSLTADGLRDSLNLAGLFDRLTEGVFGRREVSWAAENLRQFQHPHLDHWHLIQLFYSPIF